MICVFFALFICLYVSGVLFWTGISCIAGGLFTSWATREAIILIIFSLWVSLDGW